MGVARGSRLSLHKLTSCHFCCEDEDDLGDFLDFVIWAVKMRRILGNLSFGL